MKALSFENAISRHAAPGGAESPLKKFEKRCFNMGREYGRAAADANPLVARFEQASAVTCAAIRERAAEEMKKAIKNRDKAESDLKRLLQELDRLEEPVREETPPRPPSGIGQVKMSTSVSRNDEKTISETASENYEAHRARKYADHSDAKWAAVLEEYRQERKSLESQISNAETSREAAIAKMHHVEDVFEADWQKVQDLFGLYWEAVAHGWDAGNLRERNIKSRRGRSELKDFEQTLRPSVKIHRNQCPKLPNSSTDVSGN